MSAVVYEKRPWGTARWARMEDGSLRSYTWVHERLRQLYVKPERCQACGEKKPIEIALRSDSQGYSFDSTSFWFLCTKCHRLIEYGHKLTTWIGVTAS